MQVPASCSGPTIILALEPHECLLDDSTKQVTCKPAQLVLTKLAGITSNITLLTQYLLSTHTVITYLFHSNYDIMNDIMHTCTSGYLSFTLLPPVLACLLLMLM